MSCHSIIIVVNETPGDARTPERRYRSGENVFIQLKTFGGQNFFDIFDALIHRFGRPGQFDLHGDQAADDASEIGSSRWYNRQVLHQLNRHSGSGYQFFEVAPVPQIVPVVVKPVKTGVNPPASLRVAATRRAWIASGNKKDKNVAESPAGSGS